MGIYENFLARSFFKNISGFPVYNGITTRYMGDFSYKNQTGEEEALQNLRLMDLTKTKQVHKLIPQHGDEIAEARPNTLMLNYYFADGLIYHNTDEDYDPLLMTLTADCPIIILTDPQRNFYALVHSGWPSTKREIVKRMIKKIQDSFNVRPNDILAAVYSGICVGCYEVEYGFDHGEGYFDNYIVGNKLNLKKVILEQLEGMGVPQKNISVGDYCTFHLQEKEEYLFPSFRRDKTPERSAVFAH